MKLKSILRIGLVLLITISAVLSFAGCGGGDAEGTVTVTGSASTVTVTAGGSSGGNLSVISDSVTGSGCFQTNWAHRGENFVFRTRVVDPATGFDMDDTVMENVSIVLADGTDLPMHYGDHGNDDIGDSFWAVAWEVPLDYPTGGFSYTAEAVAMDGRTGEYSQFQVESSLMMIVDWDPAFVARRSVNIENNLFDPSVVTVTQGGAVRWTNKDAAEHSVVGEGFDTGAIATDARATQVFETAGTFEVHCGIHPAETATVVVAAP
ncbi:hypothetical protein ACFLYB_01355 [Chloroflexota bacterium]